MMEGLQAVGFLPVASWANAIAGKGGYVSLRARGKGGLYQQVPDTQWRALSLLGGKHDKWKPTKLLYGGETSASSPQICRGASRLGPLGREGLMVVVVVAPGVTVRLEQRPDSSLWITLFWCYVVNR